MNRTMVVLVRPRTAEIEPVWLADWRISRLVEMFKTV